MDVLMQKHKDVHDSMEGGGRAKQDARAEKLSDPDFVLSCQYLTLTGLLKSPGTDHSGFPVRIFERCVRYAFSTRRGVNKPAATGVNTHVRKLVLGDSEEDEIARSQAGYLHPGALTELFSCGAWNFYTGFTIAIVHQATTVEAPRIRTTITIGSANHVTCNGKSAVGT